MASFTAPFRSTPDFPRFCNQNPPPRVVAAPVKSINPTASPLPFLETDSHHITHSLMNIHSASTMSTLPAEKADPNFDMEQDTHKESASTPELYIDPVAQKKLLRKLDLWIAPVMTIVFLSAYLDRSNIGNAASAGMVKDLGMTDGELGSESCDKVFSFHILTCAKML